MAGCQDRHLAVSPDRDSRRAEDHRSTSGASSGSPAGHRDPIRPPRPVHQQVRGPIPRRRVGGSSGRQPVLPDRRRGANLRRNGGEGRAGPTSDRGARRPRSSVKEGGAPMRTSLAPALILAAFLGRPCTAGADRRGIARGRRRLVDRAGRGGAADPLSHRDRRGAGRDALPGLRPDGHARPAHRADRLGRGDQGRQGPDVRRQALERHGPGVGRRDALRRPRAVPVGVPRHRRRRQGRLAGRPDHRPGPARARLQRDQRPRRLGHPAGDGRVPVHRGRRQGDSPRRRPGRRRRSSSTAAA